MSQQNTVSGRTTGVSWLPYSLTTLKPQLPLTTVPFWRSLQGPNDSAVPVESPECSWIHVCSRASPVLVFCLLESGETKRVSKEMATVQRPKRHICRWLDSSRLFRIMAEQGFPKREGAAWVTHSERVDRWGRVGWIELQKVCIQLFSWPAWSHIILTRRDWLTSCSFTTVTWVLEAPKVALRKLKKYHANVSLQC